MQLGGLSLQISGSIKRFGLIFIYLFLFFWCFVFLGSVVGVRSVRKTKTPHLQLGGLSFCKLAEVGTKRFDLVFFFFFFPLLVFVFGGRVVGVRPLPPSPPPPSHCLP
jgi:hypothetical protein